MTGLIIFTGANSSLGIPAADHLLATYPGYTVVFTVRDASSSDVNTQSLRKIISKYPEAKTIIEALDLSNLSAVHAFADSIVSKVQSGQYPSIDALVCNAYYWNLLKGPEITADGFDKTFEVAHISHAALILRLLGSLSTTGRIVLLSSDSHWPGKNVNEIYPPSIPEDFDLLINPTVDSDLTGRGFQRYATAKLVLTTWSYALNRHLEKDPNFSRITAVAINPGNLIDSRALTTSTPRSFHIKQKIFSPLLPLLRLIAGPTLRTVGPAAIDVVEIAVSPKFAGQRGFFTLLDKDQSSPESLDEAKQSKLWTETLKWAKITKENTALQGAFD